MNRVGRTPSSATAGYSGTPLPKKLGIRDNYSGNGASAGTTVFPFSMNQNYGVLGYDRTHIFNAAYVLELGNPMHGNAFVKGAVNGWRLSGVTQVQSGAPLQPNATPSRPRVRTSAFLLAPPLNVRA